MVFFVCEGCNETLKKAQVAGHATKCRSCHAVTCIDCSVTFYGDDYDMHVTCVSEAEKYEKSLYKGKKAKINPQDAWMMLISTAASPLQLKDAPADVKPYLGRLAEQTNVPRNKKKFTNFIKNSMTLRNDTLIDKIWNYLECIRNKQELNNKNNNDDNEEKSQSENNDQTIEVDVEEEKEQHQQEEDKPDKKKKSKKEKKSRREEDEDEPEKKKKSKKEKKRRREEEEEPEKKKKSKKEKKQENDKN